MIKPKTNLQAYVGKRIEGTRLIVKRIERTEYTSKGRTLFVCDCDCGTKDFKVNADNAKTGKTKSCGCLKKETSTHCNRVPDEKLKGAEELYKQGMSFAGIGRQYGVDRRTIIRYLKDIGVINNGKIN